MFVKLRPPHADWTAAYRYVLDPARHEPVLLAATTLGTTYHELAVEQDQHARAWRSDCKKPCATMYVAYAPEDRDRAADPDLRRAIAGQVLHALHVDGGKQPYTIVTHLEKAHIHDHILLNRVVEGGAIWRTDRSTVPRIRALARVLEERYDIRRLEVEGASEHRLPALELEPALLAADRASGGKAVKAHLRRSIHAAMATVLRVGAEDPYTRLELFERSLGEQGIGLDVAVSKGDGRVLGYGVYLRDEQGLMASFADGRPATWAMAHLGFSGARSPAPVLRLPEVVRSAARSPDRSPLPPTTISERMVRVATAYAELRTTSWTAYRQAGAEQGDWRRLVDSLRSHGIRILRAKRSVDGEWRLRHRSGVDLPIASLGFTSRHRLGFLLDEALTVQRRRAVVAQPQPAAPRVSALSGGVVERWQTAWDRASTSERMPTHQALVRALRAEGLAVHHDGDSWRLRDDRAAGTLHDLAVLPAGHRAHLDDLLRRAAAALGPATKASDGDGGAGKPSGTGGGPARDLRQRVAEAWQEATVDFPTPSRSELERALLRRGLQVKATEGGLMIGDDRVMLAIAKLATPSMARAIAGVLRGPQRMDPRDQVPEQGR